MSKRGTLTAKALQNILVDLFEEAGNGIESEFGTDLQDRILSEASYEYEDDDEVTDGADDAFDPPRIGAETYLNAGVMTTNAGLVVRIGSREFQLSIVRSR